MPQNYSSRESRKGLKHRQWELEAMDEASRPVMSGVNGFSSTSKEFSIPRNTIADHFYNRIKDHCKLIGRKTISDQK